MLRLPVHPHIRGVYFWVRPSFSRRAGPSPHTWGLRLLQTDRAEQRAVHPHIRGVYGRVCADLQEFPRSIPTYVGFTVVVEPAARTSTGPSPHTWGLQLGCPRAVVWLRSIPTYVGFTARPTVGSSASTGPSPHTWGLRSGSGPRGSASAVHPHIRGVYSLI